MSAWRTIITDGESMTGVAPVCDNEEPGRHDTSGSEHWVFDCCPRPHIETWSERVARRVARDLNAADAGLCS